ncbi:MAG TPA: hypothetical protein P5230_01220 [Candidatus Magasanikbacteria bacterium]|nr:hypothetical protein [Candidatus Magasanikbacteria bacterium]
MSKTFKIIITIISVLIVVLILIGAWLWYAQSQIYVKMGFAQDKFPYRMYTMEEMGKMYKQEPLEGVATTQTPEQTHAKFITALKKGDIDEAVECCVAKSEQVVFKKELERIKSIDRYAKMLKDIEIIKPEADFDSKKTYSYFIEKDGVKYGQIFTFQKNLQGVWLIESF